MTLSRTDLTGEDVARVDADVNAGVAFAAERLATLPREVSRFPLIQLRAGPAGAAESRP
ncbi:MAG: hypothetical protein P4L73_09280 [Caulobacteraceae bacterium]|nr:hypothetical protein [Caulobacteraceae bacterium]